MYTLHSETVIPLLKMFDLDKFAKSRLSVLTKYGEGGRYLNLLEDVLLALREKEGVTDPAKGLEIFLDSLDRYIGLHREIFGDYEGVLPPRPDSHASELLSGTFGEFFERHNLTALYPVFYKFYSNYGYGWG